MPSSAAARLQPIEPESQTPSEPQKLPSAVELYQMVAEAAYYRAEKRGFAPGLEAEDWTAAEAEVLARVRALQGRI